MKVIGEIIAVETTGDGLKVEAQCKHKNGAAWQSMHKVTFEARPHEAKAYYVGRKILLTIGVGR